MRRVDRPSPNHNARRDGAPIDILLLHYTGMETAGEALQRLCDPTAQVSAHYTIDEDGTVFAHVPEDRRAWHAGKAFWAGDTDVNSRSIGIELVNPGHEFGYRAFPEPQMASLITLANEILERHPIPAHRVIGHSDVAPDRKTDPGELFDWARLADAGIGLWPADTVDGKADVTGLRRLLGSFGYAVEPQGAFDHPLRSVVTAFQRHYRPERFDGEPDGETVGRLEALVAAMQG